MIAATATAVVVVVARLVGEVGGEVGGVVSGEISGVVGGCVLCLMPTYHRNRTRNIITRQTVISVPLLISSLCENN